MGDTRVNDVTRTDTAGLLDHILTARCIEFTLVECAYAGDTPGPIHSAAGHEWIAGVVCQALRPIDWLTPHYRSHPWFLARGHSWQDVLRMVLDPPHVGDDVIHLRPSVPRMLTPSGIVAQQLPVAAGVAAAIKHEHRDDSVSVVSCGDGALTIGILLETLVGAKQNGLPLMVVVENNGVQNYALTEQHVSASVSTRRLADLCGVASYRIGTDDLTGATSLVHEALARARGGEPVAVDAVVHLEHPHLVQPGGQSIMARDHVLPEPHPVSDYLRGLARSCAVSDDELDQRVRSTLERVRAEAAAIVARRRARVTAPAPSATTRANGDRPFRRSTLPPLALCPDSSAAGIERFRAWVDTALQRSSGMWIAQAGVREANGDTGALRTLEMPITERCMLGLGVGASISGLRTIVDLTVVNFGLVGMDMLATALPTYRTRATNAVAPFLALGAFGTGHNVGEQHDWDNLELMAQLPLDRLVVPGTWAQVSCALEEWWDTSESWMLALPLPVMFDAAVDVSSLFAPPTEDQADLLIACWGYDVRDAAAAAGQLREKGWRVDGIQVVDVLNPLPARLAATPPDRPVLVVATDWEGASISPRVLSAFASAGLGRTTLLHRPRGASGHGEIVATAVDVLTAAS